MTRLLIDLATVALTVIIAVLSAWIVKARMDRKGERMKLPAMFYASQVVFAMCFYVSFADATPVGARIASYLLATAACLLAGFFAYQKGRADR